MDPKSGDAPGSYIVHFERFIADERWRDDVSWPPYSRRQFTDNEIEDIWESFRGLDRKVAEPEPPVEEEIHFSAHDQALIDQAVNHLDDDLRTAYETATSNLGATAESFDNWIAPLTLIGRDGKKVILTAPNRSVQRWVEDEYLTDLRRLMELPIKILAPEPPQEKAA